MGPKWLTEDRMVLLIIRKPQKGTIPSNYRPITCLCTTLKLLLGNIVTNIGRHLAQYVSKAQKGSDSRGAKHQ